MPVSTARFPFSSWSVPWVHVAFENAAADVQEIQDQIDADWDALVARCAA